MRTFAQKPETTQPTTSAKSSTLSRSFVGQAHHPNSILHLQSMIGNQAVLRLLQSSAEERNAVLVGTALPRLEHDFARIPVSPSKAGTLLQTKLAINKPGDEYEQEADRVAEQIMRMPEPQMQLACACGRACPKCNTEQLRPERERLQTKRVRASATERVSAPPMVHEVLQSPAQPLDFATRVFMEPRFHHDFSQVRVHTDNNAADSARDIKALAYTSGHEIVFAAGQYSPSTHQGQHLIAHELAHVIQQTGPSASHSDTLRIDRQPAGPDPAAEENEVSGDEPAKDVLAGTVVTQITISLARKRVGFHTSLGMIMGDVNQIDLAPGTYTLAPEPDKQRWVIEKEGVKVGLRFDVTLNGANPWTLSYPDKLALVVTAGSLKEPKAYGDMFNSKGELIDPLWLYEDMPEEMKPKPIAGIDDFESVYYDLDYRSQGGNLSKWLMVHYRDNSKRDMNLDTITESTPRLWAAKQEALKVMDDYNTLFILNAFPTVWFILTIQPMATDPSAQPRYSASRRSIPKARKFSSSKSGESGSKEPAGEPPVSTEKPPATKGSPEAPVEAVPAAPLSDAAQTARSLAKKLADEGEPVIANLGGAGASHEPKNAINVNNQVVGRKDIPNHVNADGADVGELFAPGTLDRIEGHNMAAEAIDWSRAAPGAFKALKPGGTIKYYYRGATSDAEVTGAQLRKAGFTDVEVLHEVIVLARKPGG